MQKKVVVFILAVIIGLSVVAIVQSRKVATTKIEAAKIQLEADAGAKALDEQQQIIANLEEQKTTLDKQLRDLAVKQEARLVPATVSASPSFPKSTDAAGNATSNVAGGKGSFLAKMMGDPAMKKMIGEQQKQMLTMMYGPMFKEMKLSPEETEKLSALMFQNQMNTVEKGTGLLAGGSEDRTALQKTLADDKKEYDSQVKEMLGEERYAQFEEFNKSLPDRMAMTQLKSQFGDNPLTDSQSTQLLGVMKEERSRATADGNVAPPADVTTGFSEESMNKYFAEQEAINLRVVARAEGVLSPEQVEVLGRSLTNNLSMQRTGMSMARSFLGGDSTNNAAK